MGRWGGGGAAEQRGFAEFGTTQKELSSSSFHLHSVLPMCSFQTTGHACWSRVYGRQPWVRPVGRLGQATDARPHSEHGREGQCEGGLGAFSEEQGAGAP